MSPFEPRLAEQDRVSATLVSGETIANRDREFE